MIADDAPLTSRSPERQMADGSGHFPRAAEPVFGDAMQDLSEPATAGKGAPSSASRPFVFILGDVLERLAVHQLPPPERAVLTWIATHADRNGANAYPSIARLSRLTGLGISTVLRAIKALVQRRWLSMTHRYDERSKGTTSNLYAVHLDGEPWGDEQAARRRRRPPRVRAAQGDPSRLTDTPLSPGDDHRVRRTDTPIPSDGHPPIAGRKGTSHEPPMNLPSEPPMNPPTAAPRGRGSKAQQAIPFEPVKNKPKATDGYAQAWVEGHDDAGARVSRPTASGVACLGRAAAAHARYRDGESITGEDLLRWLRVKAKRFRSEVEDPSKQRGGMTPFGFLQWLDDDPDGRAAPWRRPEERAAAAQPAPPPERPQYTPEQAEQAARFQAILSGRPDPWRQPPAVEDAAHG